jgi:FixJ family two-component response regulator
MVENLKMPKFLIIDDDPMVASAMQRMADLVLPPDWVVLYVTNPLDGLCMVASDMSIEMLMLDVRMPLVNGIDLAVAVLRNRRDLKGKILLCSGGDYSAQQERYLFKELDFVRVEKPVDSATLKEALLSTLNR